MEINRNNYEAYLLDLLEGRLTAAGEHAVRDFLAENPDLREEAEGLVQFVLPREDHVYPFKELLKRSLPGSFSTVSEEQFDLFSIARLEGDLTAEQEWAHDSLLESSDELRAEWELWKRTRLKAPVVSYGSKRRLRKRIPANRRVVWITVLSSAAAIALLILLLRSFPPGLPTPGPLMESMPSGMAEQVELPEGIIREDPARISESVLIQPTEQRPRKVAQADGTPALFSIRRVTDRQIPADTAVEKRLAYQEEELTDVPVARLSSEKFTLYTPLQEGSYDRIESFAIPPVDPHTPGVRLERLAEVDFQAMFDSYTEEGGMTLLSVANYGLKGINLLTGSELSLMAARDEEGEVSGIRLKSRRFSFSAPLDLSE